jgi:hypothetical protein
MVLQPNQVKMVDVLSLQNNQELGIVQDFRVTLLWNLTMSRCSTFPKSTCAYNLKLYVQWQKGGLKP